MFKRLVAISLFAFIAGGAFAVPAVVDYVVDGDTFAAKVILEDDIKITVRVRLIDVDTPEIKGQCQKEIDMALAARKRTMELLPVGTTVELTEIKDDKYLGRIDARVFLSDGREVSKILIKEKLGQPYQGGKRRNWCN